MSPSRIWTGAIIRDGDRKSWDARGPMIWDNFSIFRTNCAILTSYICADPRTCLGLSRGCCHVVWWNDESCEILLPIFHSDGRKKGREEKPGLFYGLLCSELMEKVCFSGSRISLISRCEWIKSARRLVIRTRKLLCLFCREKFCKKTVYSGIEVICEFAKPCLIITKTCFW